MPGIDLEVESLERSSTEQDEIVRLAEYHLVATRHAGDPNDGDARPARQHRAIG